MSTTRRPAPGKSATVDREIVISPVIDAPRELVLEAVSEVPARKGPRKDCRSG